MTNETKQKGEPTRQTVRCVWCKWEGPSPVKRPLREPGRDYPLECRQCHGIGLEPVGDVAANANA